MEPFEDRMAAKIRKELDRLQRELVALRRAPRAQEMESGGDNTPLSEEADLAQVGEEKEIQTDVLGRLLERAAALEGALQRIEWEVYGLCISCERRISHKRLERVPEALLCFECQQEKERYKEVREPRPAEWRAVQEIFAGRKEYDE